MEITKQIAASTDDCVVTTTFGSESLSYDGNSCTIGKYSEDSNKYQAGLRFLDITIPKNAVIDSAILSVCAYNNQSGTTVRSKIEGEATDDPETFSTLEDFNSRDRTTASVTYDEVPTWTTGTWYDTPDISDIIQELVRRDGWEAGNAIAIFWGDADDLSDNASRRYFRAYDFGSPAYTAKLTINYSMPPLSRQFINVGSKSRQFIDIGSKSRQFITLR